MIFSAFATHAPERIALQDAGQSVRYGELAQRVAERRQALAGVSVLGLMLDNSVDWVLWDLAALAAGIPCVPLPFFFTRQQIDHTIATAGISHLLTPQGMQQTGIEAQQRFHPETAKITFTSGTTGTPKGVCLPARAMEQVAASLVDVLGKELVGTHVSVLPLAVLLENVAGVYAGLIAGCTIRLNGLARFGANYADLHAQLEDATSTILVPEILRTLMAQVVERGPLPKLKFIAVGGSKIDPTLITQARTLGLPVYEGYGLSECASVVSLNTPQHDRPGSVGKLLPHVSAAVVDGELRIESPGFLGYVGEDAPESFPTGDFGAIDARGFVSITGRKKNVLITSYGRNISPEWVEAALLAHPAVAQAVVYGDGQAQLSALIVPTSATADIRSAVAATNAGLPDYARIHDVQLVQPFTVESGTLTGTGRPRRQQILNLYSRRTDMSFYDRIVKETQEQRQALYSVPQLVDGLSGNISRTTYIAYLTQAFHHVNQTVPFLMSMGARLPQSKKWLHKPIIEYLEEEVGHEEWILNDIEAAGGDKEAARNSTPHLETQAMNAYNHDYINRKNPVGFLGMVFMLESTSVQIANKGAGAIREHLELPEEAFSYLYSHGELDVSHMEFFKETVNQVSDPEDQAAIIEVAQNTFRLFANVLRSIPHEGAVKHAA
ncbi:MAG: AMP-dependent synthetase [Desulfuromonas sp.]|nr:MAG: AMP-dependent synthetase [Desulfuromonas sp.]